MEFLGEEIGTEANSNLPAIITHGCLYQVIHGNAHHVCNSGENELYRFVRILVGNGLL